MKSELAATSIIAVTQAHRTDQCGKALLGARNCAAPRKIAAKAKAAWKGMTTGALRSGGSVI
jgi:hypothetical protein